MGRSEELFERAKRVMPGGVNSPVRAFNAVGGAPRFIQSAKGARITDVDGVTYIDYVGSWGPMILGHCDPVVQQAVQRAMADGLSFGAATQREVEMAELICSVVGPIEMVRMVNSGTEAVMSALRLARGFTGREKLIKFAGCYHGHSDSMLVKAGSGALTNGNPDSAGVTRGAAQDTLLAIQNSCCTVAAYDGGELVAMGRLLGDGALYWYLNDIFVLTAYQGQGIGRQVVTRLLEHIQREGLPGTEVSVALFSAQGKEGFYEKMGFQKRPGPEAGHGMEQTLRIG